jgi:hypothetical protein
MDSWRYIDMVSDSQNRKLALEAQQARLLREAIGPGRSNGWLFKVITFTIILVGMVALWAY